MVETRSSQTVYDSIAINGNYPSLDTTILVDGFTFSSTSGPVPSISLTGNSQPLGNENNNGGQPYFTHALSALQYWFSVSGPTPGTVVPINISGIYSAAGSGYGGRVNSAITVGNNWSVYNFYSDCSFGYSSYFTTSSCSDSGTFSGQLNALSTNGSSIYDNVVRLNLDTSLLTENLGGVPGAYISQAALYIDPYFYINPTWAADHPGYSITVSDGVGNTPPTLTSVPKPSTLALMGLALAGMGGLRRRKPENDRLHA